MLIPPFLIDVKKFLVVCQCSKRHLNMVVVNHIKKPESS